MNRLTTSTLLFATAAAGFAAGWFGDTQEAALSPAPALRAAKIAATTTVLAPANAEPALEFPLLMTVEECRAFLYSTDQRFAGRHPFVRGAARDFALRRWLELDAESALEEAERTPGHEFTTEGFAADLFRVWLDLNVESAIGAWNQANPVLARNVRTAFLTFLADKDAARAFAVWQSPRGKGNGVWDPAEEAIFRRWAQQNPAAAAENAVSGDARKAVAGELASTDPAKALEMFRLPDQPGYNLSGMDISLLARLLQTDPRAAQQSLTATDRVTCANLACEWSNTDPLEALRWAQSQPADSPMAQETLSAVAGKLATSDPESALQLLAAVPWAAKDSPVPGGNNAIRSAYREAFASLAATDPAHARELIQTLPEHAKAGALDGYLTYAFASDTTGAIEQCREWLANPALKEAATSAALAAFCWGHGGGARDPSEVIAALPELAEKVDSNVLSGWAKVNPTGAAEFIAQRAAAGKPLEDLQRQDVLADIAIARPEWTGVWLQRLPDAALQAETAQTLAANWGAFDPEAAARWIDSLPDGPVRESALAGFDHRNERVRGGFGGED